MILRWLASFRTARPAVKVVTGVFVAAATFVAGWEGVSLITYKDIVGVSTICYGETENVKPTDQYTPAECKAMLAMRLPQYDAGMVKCVPQVATLPDKPHIAFLSLTYNVGVGAFCGSTLAKYIKAGNIRAACLELPKWNRAGGRVVQGLVNRRADEMKLCLEGV